MCSCLGREASSTPPPRLRVRILHSAHQVPLPTSQPQRRKRTLAFRHTDELLAKRLEPKRSRGPRAKRQNAGINSSLGASLHGMLQAWPSKLHTRTVRPPSTATRMPTIFWTVASSKSQSRPARRPITSWISGTRSLQTQATNPAFRRTRSFRRTRFIDTRPASVYNADCALPSGSGAEPLTAIPHPPNRVTARSDEVQPPPPIWRSLLRCQHHRFPDSCSRTVPRRRHRPCPHELEGRLFAAPNNTLGQRTDRVAALPTAMERVWRARYVDERRARNMRRDSRGKPTRRRGWTNRPQLSCRVPMSRRATQTLRSLNGPGRGWPRTRSIGPSQRRKRQDAYQGHRDDVRGYGAGRHPAVDGEDVAGGYFGDLRAVVCPRGLWPSVANSRRRCATTGFCRVTRAAGRRRRGAERGPQIRLATTEQVWDLVDAMPVHLRPACCWGFRRAAGR